MENLLLLFRVGKKPYAIKAISVLEVIPKVNLSKVQQPIPNIVGQFNYQGQVVPVLDLTKLLGGLESQAVLSTRIVMVNLAPTNDAKRLLGLMVEQVTDTLRRDQATPIENSICLSQAAYLGEKLLYDNDVIQCLNLDQLVADITYKQTLEAMETNGATRESISN